MYVNHMLVNGVLVAVGDLPVLRDVNSCNRLQRFLGPGKDPVDGCVANESGKAATSVTQRVARRRHRQDHMQIFGAFINEKLPNSLPAMIQGSRKRIGCSSSCNKFADSKELKILLEHGKLCMLGSHQPETHFETEYPASFAASRQLPIIISFSSSVNSAGTVPMVRILFMNSRNPSSAICERFFHGEAGMRRKLMLSEREN